MDAVVDCTDRPTRQINAEVRRLIDEGATRIHVRSPAGRHCLAVAVFAPVTIRFDGSVGYLCCSLGDGADFEVTGNAGWSIGADMHSGSVLVEGVAGTNTGASMRGGRVVVRGSVGTRAGISNKGGTVIVGGDAGYMTGFMHQKGTLVICGDVDDGIGDSMYAGDIFVGGAISSLGADCVEQDMTSADHEWLSALVEPYALEPRRSWRKLGSGGRLHHFRKHEYAIWRDAL